MLNLKIAPKKLVIEERKRILERYPEASFEILSEMLDRQFQLLQARAYALLVVCGLLVTGNALIGSLFPKGQVIAPAALALRLGGGAFAVCAVAVVMLGVMRLQWITQYPGETIEGWLDYAIEYRNSKTHSFRLSTILALISAILYESSIVVYMIGYMQVN